MQGRPPTLTKPEEAIHYAIGIYYQECSKKPEVRFDDKDHMNLIEEVNKRYLLELKRNKEFDYEKYEGRFMECMDFLTQIIGKRKGK